MIVPDIAGARTSADLRGYWLAVNWIFFSPGHDAERGLNDVITALEEDIGWRDARTRLAVRTKEWIGSQRDRSFLLRGSDLQSAEEWLGQASLHEKTSPTALQTEYVVASRKNATRTQRTWRIALTVGLVVSLALAAIAFAQRQQAIHQRNVAVSRGDGNAGLGASHPSNTRQSTRLPMPPEPPSPRVS